MRKKTMLSELDEENIYKKHIKGCSFSSLVKEYKIGYIRIRKILEDRGVFLPESVKTITIIEKGCACGCKTILNYSCRDRNIFADGHEIRLDQSNLMEKECNSCNCILPVSNFKIFEQYNKYANKMHIIYAYKCDECKKGVRRLKIEEYKSNGRRKEVQEKHREKHRGEPKFHISERLSQYYKDSLKKAGVKSDLTTEYLVSIFEQQHGKCYYTGVPIHFGAEGHANASSASVDRLVPSLGYVQGNIVYCSYFVNTMKGSLTEKEFYKMIEMILELSKSRSNIT